MDNDFKTYKSRRFSDSTISLRDLDLFEDDRTEHPAVEILNEIIDSFFWQEKGFMDGPSCECKSVAEESESFNHVLKHWEKFSADAKLISERIMRKTGKDYCDLMMNSHYEHRRVQLVKRILDFAERLRPENVLSRREQLYRVKCSDIFETLPATESEGVAKLTIADLPQMSLEEKGMHECVLKKSSWLKSKYLADKIFKNADDICRVISYFPDILRLQVDCKRKPAVEDTTSRDANSTDHLQNSLSVSESIYRQEETVSPYSIRVNDQTFTLKDPARSENIEFNITFENDIYTKTKLTMLTIENLGWKTVDFHWTQDVEKYSYTREQISRRYPAFFFDKNDFRLITSAKILVPLIFCAGRSGIYTEKWILNSKPSFFSPGCEFIVNMFGVAKNLESEVNSFYNLQKNLRARAARNMTVKILSNIATHAVPEPPTKPPYTHFITEKEIFSNLNKDLNYTEKALEQLKDIYAKANSGCSCCPKWDYDLEALREQLLNIKDAQLRRTLYFKLIDVVQRMKRKPPKTAAVYDDQKFLLVKAVLLGAMDKIEETAETLKENMFHTDVPLEFDEALVSYSDAKVPEKTLPSSLVKHDLKERSISSFPEEERLYAINERGGSRQQATVLEEPSISSRPYSVVKTKRLTNDQKIVYRDSFYMQVFSHLGNAAEEIAGVVEGMQHFY